MKKFGLILALTLLTLPPLIAQVSNPSIIVVPSAPSGSCGGSGLPMQYVFSTGVLYACQNGTWGQIGGGGGGGPYLPLAGGTMTGPAVLFTGSTAPTQAAGDASTDIANDQFVSNAIAGVNPAVAVLAASTANLTGTYAQVGGGVGDTFTITATGAFTLDGIAINTIGQRVLFKDQSTASQNGVYTATIVGTTGVSPVFTRASDYNTPADVNNTGAIPVQSGTANTTTSWLLTSQVTSIGSAGSSLTYALFSYAPTTLLLKANNLSDVASPATAVANLGAGYTLFKQNTVTAVNSTTSETALFTGTIPAGAIGANSNIQWNAIFLGETSVSTCIFKAYLNSSTSIGGLTMWTSTTLASGGRNVLAFGKLGTANSQASEFANAVSFYNTNNVQYNGAPANGSINLASTAYFIVTATPGSATTDANGCAMSSLHVVLYP